MSDWKVGDQVFAYWPEDDYWYPATVTGLDGEQVEVRYEDGTEEATTSEYVFDLDINPGDEAESLRSDVNEYSPAMVVNVNEDQVQVQYPDGFNEWVPVSSLRYPAENIWEEGNRAFAFRQQDGYWYPATVISVSEKGVEILYDDGSRAVVDQGDLDELIVTIGDDVECLRDQDGEYEPAIVDDVHEERAQVEYESGETEWTEISKIRIKGE